MLFEWNFECAPVRPSPERPDALSGSERAIQAIGRLFRARSTTREIREQNRRRTNSNALRPPER